MSIVDQTITGDTFSALFTTIIAATEIGLKTHPIVGIGLGAWGGGAWGYHIAKKCLKESTECP